jgi:hypothetical protein
VVLKNHIDIEESIVNILKALKILELENIELVFEKINVVAKAFS